MRWIFLVDGMQVDEPEGGEGFPSYHVVCHGCPPTYTIKLVGVAKVIYSWHTLYHRPCNKRLTEHSSSRRTSIDEVCTQGLSHPDAP